MKWVGLPCGSAYLDPQVLICLRKKAGPIYGQPCVVCWSREVRRLNLGWLLIAGRSDAETYVGY